MPTAILSVHDKTGLAEFAAGLDALGWRLLASGGTAKLLRENHLPVTEVAEYTASPEILGGRVKTLHPAIHGGLLARPTAEHHAELLAHGWDWIDLAVVNLYPFEATIARPGATLAEAIENIDIGGVTLIRAAAKNHERVTLLCDPADYPALLEELRAGGVSAGTRARLAVKGFAHTAAYDAAVAEYLSRPQASLNVERSTFNDENGRFRSMKLYPVQPLRYGENPHQQATLYAYQPGGGPMGGQLLQGKALSYTNLLDLDGAWRPVASFNQPAIVIVKHASPCGIATAPALEAAFRAALASDPVSAFGGVIAANRPFDAATVGALGELFTECIIAPGFSAEARELLAKRKNCRLLDMPDLTIEPRIELRSITRGVLAQEIDFGDPAGINPTGINPAGAQPWQVVSQRQPSESEWAALRFAWVACQHVKSNAIVFALGDGESAATVGIGGGQPNRVDCVRIACQRAGERAQGAVMASDAFFPFPDSVEVAAEAGITAIVHPGGSVRDAEAVAAADAHGIAMATTGVRHFRH